MDHVVPRALYPESKRGSDIQRITVPACEACNRSWVDDEPHFRTVLLCCGDSSPIVNELWYGRTLRSFDQVDGVRRCRDVARQLVPVKVAGVNRHKVYPADDSRFMRVLRKVVRGLSHHHDVLTPVSDGQLWADVQRFPPPPEFVAGMTAGHADPDVLEYRWATLQGDEFVHSWWLLKFFGRTPFIALVFHSPEALAASERAAKP